MSIEKLLVTLNHFAERMDRLEKGLTDKKNPPIHFDIQIKDLHLNELNLEELAFHLEKLDIKELSGMLNLGNTFSPKVHSKQKADGLAPQEIPESSETTGCRDIEVLINGSPVMYTIVEGKDEQDE
ncbi:hypothetical protein D1B31_07905 [Neobacillus notoginsengisoli]|uniref:Uncharacterized protein n=1 Tax=Neobacillus notoginsengisoli TaxID=1578198 RepID=A0A417YW75_9BACI|nr:hypothetical protein [Neobacillus notoginsengisoli]RHW41632.1 hypothetical protein D1B31_07905 [Neobacillus notoginsengisoli]